MYFLAAMVFGTIAARPGDEAFFNDARVNFTTPCSRKSKVAGCRSDFATIA